MKQILIKRISFIIVLILLWQLIYSLKLFPEMLFPSILNILESLFVGLENKELINAAGYSLYLIFIGLFFGFIIALLLAIVANNSRFLGGGIETLISLMHPLPGLALLPLLILWFGIGESSIIVIIIHSTLWPMVLNIQSGIKSVPAIYKEVGKNIGLRGTKLTLSIMIPASFPFLLTGIKIAWARSWRALIGAEMVFGATGTSGGLGWYIFQQRFFMDISGVFASLIVIIIVGILVEDLILGYLEKRTVKKWGMIN